MGEASCGGWPTSRFRPRIASPIPRRIAAGLFAFLCAFCCMAVPSRASSAFLSEQGSVLVSIDAVSQDAKAIIAQLAASAGVNVVVDDSIVSKVTVHLADVPFDHALETIARAAGAEVAAEKGLYVVTNSRAYYGPPQAAAEQTVSQILDVANVEFSSALTLVRAVAKDLEIEPFPELGAVMLRGPYSQVNAAKAALDGYLRSSSPYGQADVQGFRLVRLAYADASESSMSLQGQFQSVRIVPVRGENAVVVSGPARHADQAAAAIRELDRAPALLSFDAEILEVNSDDMDSFGIDWQNSQGQPVLTLTLKEIDSPIIPGVPPSSDVFSARPWIRTSLQIVSQIKLLEGAGKAKVLARPSITTLENRTARIITGDRYTIVINQTSGGSSWQQLQYIDSGVHLELIARLDSDGGIVVTLTPRISAVTGFSREGYPVMSTREAQTTVRLRDGETLAIGGLIRDETNESRSGLPWLSSLGFLGRLFGSQSKQAKRTEVVILLTPRIVDPE